MVGKAANKLILIEVRMVYHRNEAERRRRQSK